MLRVSAALESVDEEFGSLLEERNSYLREMGKLARLEPLNVDVLTAILDNTLPEQNKQAPEPYATILEDLIDFEVKTADKLRALIDTHVGAVLEDDAAKVKQLQTGENPPSPESRLGRRSAAGVFFSHLGLVRQIMRRDDPKRFERMLKKYDSRA